MSNKWMSDGLHELVTLLLLSCGMEQNAGLVTQENESKMGVGCVSSIGQEEDEFHILYPSLTPVLGCERQHKLIGQHACSSVFVEV